MGAALKFRHADVPKQSAERARLKVVHGPDRGSIFVITTNQATVGRGEENDIILADLKSSRKHAEIAWNNNQWSVRDLGSANGIQHNGRTTRAAALKTSDTITLGDTTMEFVLVEAGTAMLRAVPREIAEIKKEQAIFSAQQDKVRALGQIGGPNRPKQKGAAQPVNKTNPRTLLLLAGAGVAVYLLLSSDDSPRQKRVKAQQSLASYLPNTPSTDAAVNKTAEVFFKQGFREYRERNYLRAKIQFETALQISPGHPLATLYLENCNKEIKDAVKFELERGRKDFEAGKLKEAKNHFEAVLRLQYREQGSPTFVEAQEQLKQVEQELAGMRNE
jgi:pSer/pThr/pTyr-binding forkhead associated (FHA) protein